MIGTGSSDTYPENTNSGTPIGYATNAMSGVITMKDHASVTGGTEAGAALGSGARGMMTGLIRFLGGNLSNDGFDAPLTVGSGPFGYSFGHIYVGKDARMDSHGNDSYLGTMDGKEEINQEILDRISGDPYFKAITIERGAVIDGTTILDHKTADPYLNCLYYPQKTTEEGHVHVYIIDPPADPIGQALEGTGHQVSVYQVTTEGRQAEHAAQHRDDVLCITADYADAEFRTTLQGLKILQAQGIRTVVFKTAEAESRFSVADVLAAEADGDNLVLSHRGKQAKLTLGTTDLKDLLK